MMRTWDVNSEGKIEDRFEFWNNYSTHSRTRTWDRTTWDRTGLYDSKFEFKFNFLPYKGFRFQGLGVDIGYHYRTQ